MHTSNPPVTTYKVTCNGKAFWLTPGSYSIGRSSLCNIVVDDTKSSRSHARLTLGAQAEIEDLGSANGTLVNGERLSKARKRLTDGDRILIGTTEIVLFSGQAPSSRAPEAAVPRSYSGLMRGVRDASSLPTSATSRADPLQLIGEVADRALRAGHVENAIGLLEPELARVLSEAGKDAVTPAQLDWGVDRALQLATATSDGKWLDTAFKLLRAAGRAPSSEARFAALEQAIDRVHKIAVRGFYDYVDVLRRSASLASPDEGAAFRRIEALVGKVVPKSQ